MFLNCVLELIKVIRDWLLKDDYEALFLLGPHPLFLSANPKHAEVNVTWFLNFSMHNAGLIESS